MVYNRLEDILLHYILYWSGRPHIGAYPFNVKWVMGERTRQLGNKAYINVTCPNCECDEDHRREGVDPGHSYLEFIYGEEYECSFCGQEMRVDMDFMYSFVRN